MKSASQAAGARKRRFVVGIFVHNYRWGWQIRGDERGYVEKVRAYGNFGIDFFTLEKKPSIQDGMNEHLYNSMILGECRIPPRGIGDLLLLSLYSLRSSLRRYKSRPLAIYAYNQDIENLWVAYILKLLLVAPLVVVYHQIHPPSFTPFRTGLADRLKRGFHPVRAIYNSLLPALNRFAADHADVHIALSEATRQDVEKWVGIKNCVVVRNGLDTTKFRPVKVPKTIDAVFLGRLARQKGVDILLNAWSRVVQENPTLQLVLLGGGEPEDVGLYKRMTKELRLERNVTFAGFVSDEELVSALNESKLFVFPSREEGFAQAVSQAMGCGLCCILSDIPPLVELYGGAAAFFPVNQPEALAERIMHILGAEDERTMYGMKARRLAEGFSWDDTARRELAEIMGTGKVD